MHSIIAAIAYAEEAHIIGIKKCYGTGGCSSEFAAPVTLLGIRLQFELILRPKTGS